MRIKSKINGLMALRGYWIKSMVVGVILALLSIGISQLENAYCSVFNVSLVNEAGRFIFEPRVLIADAVATVISFLILSPLIIGMFEWYWNITDGKEAKIGDIFAWYGSGRLYGKSLLLSLNIGIRMILWSVLLFAVPTALEIVGNLLMTSVGTNVAEMTGDTLMKYAIGVICLLGGFLLMLGAALLYVFIVSRYIPAVYLFTENKDLKSSEAIKISVKYSKVYRWEYTKFVLSYIGWFITCIFLLPLLYVIPYFFSSLTVFTKSIIYSERGKEKSDETKSFDVPKYDTSDVQ